ncbi:MAG TPA: hypothetical protein VHZ24_12730 [Pirellulales bacterium]|jgi:hypothetical protein|nr:hypothetical protein [Pirellulales bacterium]
MRSVALVVAACAGLVLLRAAWCQPPTGPKPTVELRRPGFVFLELGTPHVDEYAAYFQAVAGFHKTSGDKGFTTLESDVAQIMVMHPDELPNGHPFFRKLLGREQGLGVEIGIVVADLDRSFAAAKEHGRWKISSGIAMRPWGVRDFRAVSPDGYYLRFTEPPRS